MTIAALLQENASAVFGFAGAFGAALLSFGSGWILRRRDFDLRLWDKLVDRRIVAHERVMKIAMDMRMMYTSHGHDSNGELRRAPHVLASNEHVEQWFTEALKLAVNRVQTRDVLRTGLSCESSSGTKGYPK